MTVIAVLTSAWLGKPRMHTLKAVMNEACTMARTRLLGCLAAGGLLVFAANAHALGKASDSAVVLALRDEARAYEHGEGVEKNPARAVELYCNAARLGDAEAQFSLGWMYANARGVPRDDALAGYYFRLAASQGHEHAHKMLRFVGEAAVGTPECLLEKHFEDKTAQEQPVEPGAARPDEQGTGVVQSAPETPLPDFVAVTPAQKKALEIVKMLAPSFGINPRLALAVIRAESNFDPLARSEKNAQGLMQLIPETAARFNIVKPFDPIQNVRGGLAYLRWLLSYFRGDVTLVAAAYNAGEGTVNRYGGIPPYPETRAYVKRIIGFFGRNIHPYDESVTEESPLLLRIRAAAGF